MTGLGLKGSGVESVVSATESLERQRPLVRRIVRSQADRTIDSQRSLFSEIFGKPIKQDMFDKDRTKPRKTVKLRREKGVAAKIAFPYVLYTVLC